MASLLERPLVGTDLTGLPDEGNQLEFLRFMTQVPLGNVKDYAGLSGKPQGVVYSLLEVLEADGLVEPLDLGCSLQRGKRFRVTNRGLQWLRTEGTTWHEEWAVCRLLERITSVEWFYTVSSSIAGLGSLQQFCWLDGLSLDAAARYEHGWVALFWSGYLQDENTLVERLRRLAADLQSVALYDPMPWPGMLVFVVNDEWQRELVNRAVRRYGLHNQTQIWCISDGKCTGRLDPGFSRGFVRQVNYPRGIGGWSLSKRLESSPWNCMRPVLLGRLLDAVAQWPGIASTSLRVMFNHGDSNKTVYRGLAALLELRLVERFEEHSRYHYGLTNRARSMLAGRDRTSYQRAFTKVDHTSWLHKPKLRHHESGVMAFLGAATNSGIPVAAGWRSWEPMGKSGGIAPDGLVYLKQSPFGSGWHYFEYERSARGEYRVRSKLRGYGSPERQDRWPVLLICWNDSVEGIFQKVGQEMELRMATTTMSRFKANGAFGVEGTWEVYGKPGGALL